MRTASMTLTAVLAVVLAGPARAACPGCGRVAGSVSVESATVRTEGPKNDLDVVVTLQPAGRDVPPAKDARASMDQTGLVFVPHVLAVAPGTTVTFLNNDQEQHNVYFLDDRTGETLDIGTWGPGVSVDHTFRQPGVMITLCKLHLEMAAYVVVSPSPWFAKVRLDPATSAARFEIGDVPAGSYELVVWHKKLKQKGGAVRLEVTPRGVAERQIVITTARNARSGD